MVALSIVQFANASLVATQPLVAVFFGGTSGIGMHTIKVLAATCGKERKLALRVYIIGRNAKAAEEIIFDCQTVCPTGQFHFIRANDLALMKDVDLVCADLVLREEKEAKEIGETPRIDILVMTQAIFKPWNSRNETSEGLDRMMSLLYYSRMRLTIGVMPLLLASILPARVISVFGPGRDTTFIPTDLSLRSPKNYSFHNADSHAAYLTTFFMEHLAAQYAGKVAFIHNFPGLVLSEKFVDPTFPFWFRATFKYLSPLVRMMPMTLSGEESGARTLFYASSRFPSRAADGGATPVDRLERIGLAASSDGIVGGGAYRTNWNGKEVATGKQYVKLREEGWLEKAVEHTLNVFKEIEAGRRFTA